jgi:YHS domain-containing protein
MKSVTFIVLLLVTFSSSAQKIDYNLKKGYVAEGYDVTEYFNNKAVAGSNKFTATHDGVNYKFVSQENLDKFKANPSQFVPQYGGYCAYAVADKGKKVGIDPKTFEIRDGKLYLFYNSWGVNTLEKWQEEGAEKLKGQADAAWSKVQYKH